MVEYSLLIYPWKIFYISSTKWRVMCNIISVYTCRSLIGIITDWYYRITQCDIPSLIIYITYISCLNNENAIVNPRGYDYFRNRWNLVILKHRRSLGVREGTLTVQCTSRRHPALISFHVTIPKWVHVPLINQMTAGQTCSLCSESTRKVQPFSPSVLIMM